MDRTVIGIVGMILSACLLAFISWRIARRQWASKNYMLIKDVVLVRVLSDSLVGDSKYSQQVAVRAKLLRIGGGEVFLRLSGEERQLIAEMIDIASRGNPHPANG